MDYLMILILILGVGTLNVACFFIGAKVGQKVNKGETLELSSVLPSVNPADKIRERQEKKAAQAEQERIETILRNIESYDGTGAGQKEVPRG